MSTKGRRPPPPSGGHPEKPGRVEVSSGYGFNTRVPFIELKLPEREPLQLEIDEARIVGQMILESCEAAESDAFIVEFIMSQYTDEPEETRMRIAAGFLNDYRMWRNKRRKKRTTTSA